MMKRFRLSMMYDLDFLCDLLKMSDENYPLDLLKMKDFDY
jgi:hypothetical protein